MVQLNVVYSMGWLDALWVERARGTAVPLRTLALFAKTKRARERTFHHSVTPSRMETPDREPTSSTLRQF